MRRVTGRPSTREAEGNDQIHQDVVVIACVQCHVVSLRSHDRPHHVQRAIAVEGRDLDRHDLGQFKKTPPESVVQWPATHFRIQVKAKQRNDLTDLTTVRNQRVVVGIG